MEHNVEDQLSYQEAQRKENLRHEEILATLAHELRNPLAAISNVLEIWSTTEHDPAQMALLRRIARHQLDQMLRLSDDLLEHFLGFDLDTGPGVTQCILSRALHNANPPGILEAIQTKLRPPLSPASISGRSGSGRSFLSALYWG